jgi:hypothetical protein
MVRSAARAVVAPHLQLPELDTAPLLAILKLWMLYRFATRT